MHNIGVLGCGYVGLVTGACLAELGNRVICSDTDAPKIQSLHDGALPFYEPGLLELVLRNQHSGRLAFSTSVASAVSESDIVFIAVGTPMTGDGRTDLTHVYEAAIGIAHALNGPKIVVNKSTVPVQTGDVVAGLIEEHAPSAHEVCVVSNPEFLREGSAIADFMKPDRIILGVADSAAEHVMRDLYAPLRAPILVTDVKTAEMIKYTANAFLATKISFINEIAGICERVGADIADVIAGAGSDQRIGMSYMQPGLGFGGSCLPKDVLALQRMAEEVDIAPRVLSAVLAVNHKQVEMLLDLVGDVVGPLCGKRIGLLGLSFKPNTDDLRHSPAVAVANGLASSGVLVVAHDPAARPKAGSGLDQRIILASDTYEAANDAHGLIVATDWNEYKQIDFTMLKKLMAEPVLFDARNLYDPRKVRAAGLTYVKIGMRLDRLPSAMPLK